MEEDFAEKEPAVTGDSLVLPSTFQHDHLES